MVHSEKNTNFLIFYCLSITYLFWRSMKCHGGGPPDLKETGAVLHQTLCSNNSDAVSIKDYNLL